MKKTKKYIEQFFIFFIIYLKSIVANSLIEGYKAIYMKSYVFPIKMINEDQDEEQNQEDENDFEENNNLYSEIDDVIKVNKLFNQFKKLDDAWLKCKNVLINIRKWSQSEQQKLNINISEIIIYPFGGGDIVYPMNFFPDFKEMVIIGLEPAGKGLYLNEPDSVVNNLTYLFWHGNFVTRDMEAFAKTGGIFTIIFIQLIKQEARNITYIISNSSIEFKFIWEGKERKIIYYRMNLHDDNFHAWAKLFENYKNFTLFMKSASFVPQQIGFKKIRDMLVENANLILQDDTGISYNLLQKNGFKIEIYGEYYLRYKIRGLEGFFQEDLKEAYIKKKPDLLPFRIGYRSEILPGNILWAYKTQMNDNTIRS